MTKGVVASGSIDTSKAGEFALNLGGNAVDAIIAAQLAAHVCEPMLTGFGGSGIATIKFGNEQYCLDFFTVMPDWSTDWNIQQMDTVALNFGSTSQSFHMGRSSISLPTMPNGLFALHKRHGTLPLNVLAKPAQMLITNGFKVTKSSEYILQLLHPIYSNSSTMTKWYTDNGTPKTAGMLCRCPEMLEDLESFIEHGDALFVQEKYLDSLSKTLHNSKMNVKTSFEKYSVNENPGTTKVFKDSKITMLCPRMPSRGSELLMYILNKHPFPASNPSELKDFVHTIHEAYTQTESIVDDYYDAKTGFTTHVSAVDKYGNAVSLTTSLGESAGMVAKDTGIILNNFLGESDVAHPSATSKIGSRLQTMCTPTILWNEMGDVISIGTGGSGRIPTILSQVIQSILANPNESWNDRLRRPRIHPVVEREIIQEVCIENFGIMKQISTELHKFHNNIKSFSEQNMYFGGVHAAEMKDGIHRGGGDNRRNGHACILD